VIENIIKLFEIPQTVGLVILLFAAAIKLSKRYFDNLLDEKSKTLKWFAEQIVDIDNIQPYRLEQLFTERYGIIFSYPRIRYFLSKNSPSEMIHYYLKAKGYFVFSEDGSILSAIPRKKWLSLRITKNLYGIGYYASAFLSFSLIHFLPTIYSESIGAFITAYFFIFVGLALAAGFLVSQRKVECAAYLKDKLENL
jgi:hypothetical protein